MYIAIVVLVLATTLTGYYLYTTSLPRKVETAQRKAHDFCAAIAIGSDISTALAKAKTDHVFWGAVRGYTFYFPATMFDKAVCEVSVDRTGKVVSKGAKMEYD